MSKRNFQKFECFGKIATNKLRTTNFVQQTSYNKLRTSNFVHQTSYFVLQTSYIEKRLALLGN